MGQSYMGRGDGVGHTGWSEVGHAVKQPKNDSPQNQDLTPPKSLEGVQNPSFEYKNNFYYYFIITIVLYSQLYQKIITRCSLYKKSQWHDYYISSMRKKQKGCLCSQWN